MKVNPSYMSKDDINSTTKPRKSSELLLSKDIPEESIIEMNLVDQLTIPERFKHYSPKNVKILSIKYSSSSVATTDLLLENIVVEYRDSVNQNMALEQIHDSYSGSRSSCQNTATLSVNYLIDYVSVGIPCGRYKWLLKKVSELTGNTHNFYCEFEDEEYVWVSAQLLINQIYKKPKCYVYDKKKDDTVPVGTPSDTLNNLKSNLIGYGQFKVRTIKNYKDENIMSLLLTGFQMVDLTMKQSYPKPSIAVAPSDTPLKSLGELQLNDN